jgi:hypothetical protein
VPSRPAVSHDFQLAMLLGLSGSKAAQYTKILKGKIGAGAAVDVLFFQVWDTTNNLACVYAYVGAGAGAGFTILPPVSGTARGPWNAFTTSAPLSSGQFGGPGPLGNPLVNARFTTAGAGPKTINIIHLMGTPPGVDHIYMKIDTGFTYGAGISSTVGRLILVEGPAPFTGP